MTAFRALKAGIFALRKLGRAADFAELSPHPLQSAHNFNFAVLPDSAKPRKISPRHSITANALPE
jgi:hypothetical protein